MTKTLKTKAPAPVHFKAFATVGELRAFLATLPAETPLCAEGHDGNGFSHGWQLSNYTDNLGATPRERRAPMVLFQSPWC